MCTLQANNWYLVMQRVQPLLCLPCAEASSASLAASPTLLKMKRAPSLPRGVGEGRVRKLRSPQIHAHHNPGGLVKHSVEDTSPNQCSLSRASASPWEGGVPFARIVVANHWLPKGRHTPPLLSSPSHLHLWIHFGVHPVYTRSWMWRRNFVKKVPASAGTL